MSQGPGGAVGAEGTNPSRRAVLQSGLAVAAAGYVGHSSTSVASAQTNDNWPIQGYDPANTRYTTETAPLKVEPAERASADISIGPPDDFLLTGSVAYMHALNNGIGAVDTETGELQWNFNPRDVPLIPEGIDGNDVLARATDGTIYAIDTDTGEPTFELEVGAGIGLGYTGSERWFAPTSDGKVVAGDVGSESPAWETSVDGVGFRPAVGENLVFVSTALTDPENVDRWDPDSLDAEGKLYALNASDGSVVWESSRVGAGLGAPVVRDGRVYWPGGDGDILVEDAETGSRVWEFKTSGTFGRSLAVAGDVLLAGNRDGHLYAVNRDTQEQIGRIPAGTPVSTDPVVVGDVIYFGTDGGTVHAFERGSGPLWEFDAGASVRALAPDNERLVVGTDDGYYVLGAEGTSGDSGGGSSSEGFGSGGSDGSGGSGGDASEQRQRGLFSNDGNEPEYLSNPFNLTTLGFLLSVAGIAHQMLRGG